MRDFAVDVVMAGVGGYKDTVDLGFAAAIRYNDGNREALACLRKPGPCMRCGGRRKREVESLKIALVTTCMMRDESNISKLRSVLCFAAPTKKLLFVGDGGIQITYS